MDAGARRQSLPPRDAVRLGALQEVDVILDSILGWFSNDLAIDLGTANTVVYAKGQGIVGF